MPGSMEIYKIIAQAGANEAQYCIQNFEEVIREAAGYDYIFLDTNPSANLATMCALEAAHFIVAPMIHLVPDTDDPLILVQPAVFVGENFLQNADAAHGEDVHRRQSQLLTITAIIDAIPGPAGLA